MKRALEAVLAVAALALGAYVVRQGLARRALAEHPPAAHPGYAPGPDVANPAVLAATQPGSVQGLPMLKLSRPPKPSRDEPDVPPPAPSTP